LAAAIESALAQTRPADEVLLVYDASTDATRAIATDAKWRGRVRYVYNDKASGFADAFNRVARLASSEFVVFLSADDVLAPSFLETIEGGLLTYPEAKFCYVAANYIGSDGKPIPSAATQLSSLPRLYDGKSYVHNYLVGCLTKTEIHRCAGTAVERRLFVEECQFRKEAGIMADNDFFIRIAAKTAVVGTAQPLASVRLHAEAISSRMESLSLRVAEDYLYQVRFLVTQPQYVAEEDMKLVYLLAFRSVALLLSEAVLRGRPDLCSAGILIMQELVSVIGPEASRASVAQTGTLPYLIYRWSWVRYLYKMNVSAASVGKKLKRIFRIAFLCDKIIDQRNSSTLQEL
jgi:glycosyltransferase involved in cell wall biosynthesis